ncbi:MAG: HEAT repeat domain-containing protein [Planctomycetes bacterium]|nr:HEAT repeat domain-containing protein [Planctomycetota bacterium]
MIRARFSVFVPPLFVLPVFVIYFPTPPFPQGKQDSPPASQKKDPKQDAKKDAPTWPKLDYNKSIELGKLIDELKRATAPEIVEHATDKIQEFGKSAIPLLYEALTRQKVAAEEDLSQDARRVLKVIDPLPKAEDGPILALDCAHRNALIRRFALRKSGELVCAESLTPALKALKDADETCRFEAALCCASLGSTEGFDILLKVARGDEWPNFGARVRKAVERHRSPEATQKALPGLKSKEWQEVCASLRLLAGWGMKDCAHEVGSHLGSTDHRIKEAAINALRGIMDNEGPIEKLSAFDLAELANTWSKRL